MLAGYRCERCGGNRDLQVHHRTYERLGHEWDQDLEVLCDDCHGNHHALQKAKRGDPVRLFVVLAGHALQFDRTVTTYGDLAEAVKVQSARLAIPYDSAKVGAAIDVVLGKRPLEATAPVVAEPVIHSAINRHDAFRILADLYRTGKLPQLKPVAPSPAPPRGHAVRTWKRATVVMVCGGCNRDIAPGSPFVLIEITYLGAVTRRRRCDQCEGPAPPDLPALIERTNTITPTPLRTFSRLLPLGTPLADFRARQSGEREPGEDG